MEFVNDTEIQEEYRKRCKELSDLTGYPFSVIVNILWSFQLLALNEVAESTEDTDVKPEDMEIPIPPWGSLVYHRNLDTHDAEPTFGFRPTVEFYGKFWNAYFKGRADLLDIVEDNFNKIMMNKTSDNLLDIGDFDV